MTATWLTVLVGCGLCYAAKLAGYLVPAELLERPTVARVSALLPVALLAALVAVQTVAVGRAIVVDARVVALGVAVVALLLRAPFLLVVVLAAATAALLRALL